MFSIRQQINAVKSKINQSFSSALSSSHTAGYLDDIRESVVENRRVLAVKAMYRRKVKGTALGSSKTGSIVYIEPQATEQYSRDLSNLLFDEKEEINRILRSLTNFLRPFALLLTDYQSYLATMDVTAAKARYAEQLNAVLPTVSDERILNLKRPTTLFYLFPISGKVKKRILNLLAYKRIIELL